MSKQKYKSNFQDLWLENETFKAWLQKKPGDPHKARCKVCAKDISISLHGITALHSHADGTKHKERLPKDTPISFFKRTEPSSSTAPLSSNDAGDSSKASSSSKQTTISTCTNKQLVTKAEIIWALDVVMSKYSFNSSSNKGDLFTTMFPDSEIAKDFSCGKTKCGFIVKFGIAPYFLELLNSQLKDLEYFVALFDESFNYVAKKNQMDLHIRFWDSNKDVVATRYYSSEFLGKSSANDICSHFEQCLGPLEKEKLIQVSSDGPNVNLLFLKVLAEKRKDEELTQLIDLGTCGLHTAHNAIKHGEKASEWQLKKLMSSMIKIFHEAPGRRADYKTITDATEKDYPMLFVSHRWVENAPVAKKARLIWPKIIEIVTYWQQLAKSKQPGLGKPGANTSYDHLCKAVKDCLAPVKLLFFEEVAKKLNEFLVVFQTDKPMAPFLTETLENLIRTLMSKFIRKDLLGKSCSEMAKLDFKDVNNQKPTHLVDLGFAVNHEIQLLKGSKKITDSQILKFKKEAVGFLATLCTHLMEKSPVKSFFARCLRCLSPNYIAECSETCEKLFDRILSKLVSYKLITPDTADRSKSQYNKFTTTVVKENKPEFLNYSKTDQRLDEFMMKFVGGSTKFSELCKVFKILLILSHGQAQVERGFSVNKNLLVENQHTTSLTAQRIIHDHMVYHELESSNLTVTAKLSNHVKQARSRYFNEQKERSMQKVTSDRDVRMKQINEDIDDANRNITQLQETINSFQTSADEYAFEAEEKSSVAEIKSLISKSNALKRAATEKQSLLDSLAKKKRLLIEKKDEL
jgi:hypothetical protein